MRDPEEAMVIVVLPDYPDLLGLTVRGAQPVRKAKRAGRETEVLKDHQETLAPLVPLVPMAPMALKEMLAPLGLQETLGCVPARVTKRTATVPARRSNGCRGTSACGVTLHSTVTKTTAL